MRILMVLVLVCALFFTSAQADSLTAVGAGAAQFCCINGSIMMDATQSTPWDDITHIWWDWNNDGTYEVGGARDTYDTYPATWSAGGAYYVTVKVVNIEPDPDDFDTDTSQLPFYVGQAILIATPSSGRAPLSVHFDASHSLPGSLSQTYEWDFNYQGGAFNWTSGSEEEDHVYSSPGTYYCYVRVRYDGNNNWKCTTYVQITVT